MAQSALESPPATEVDRAGYYQINADLWRQLAIWFELRAPDSE